MPKTPFFPTFGQLPDTLPVFPLAGAVVMPASDLPLNIFETRYLNMVEDALRTHRMFGMIQPDPSREGDPPPVYRTGCAGRITSFTETADGRIELVLTGICRFDITSELTTTRGYRLVQPEWQRFESDFTTPASAPMRESAQLLRVLKRYFDAKGLQTDWAKLQALPASRMTDVLTTLLPLDPAAKQMVLETLDPSARAQALLAALEVAVSPDDRHPRPH
jgi:Lon protease-like protein